METDARHKKINNTTTLTASGCNNSVPGDKIDHLLSWQTSRWDTRLLLWTTLYPPRHGLATTCVTDGCGCAGCRDRFWRTADRKNQKKISAKSPPTRAGTRSCPTTRAASLPAVSETWCSLRHQTAGRLHPTPCTHLPFFAFCALYCAYPTQGDPAISQSRLTFFRLFMYVHVAGTGMIQPLHILVTRLTMNSYSSRSLTSQFDPDCAAVDAARAVKTTRPSGRIAVDTMTIVALLLCAWCSGSTL